LTVKELNVLLFATRVLQFKRYLN